MPSLTGVTPAHQSIAIERAGAQVQKRTNELSSKIFDKPVYGRGSFFDLFGPNDTDKPAELRVAQKLLETLASYTRPATATEART